MAFNVQTFRTRVQTSVVFALIMMAGSFANKWTFLALFTVIHFGCWVEFQKLMSLIDPGYVTINKVHKYAVMVAGWGFMLWMSTNSRYTSVYNIGYLKTDMAGKWLCIAGLVVTVVAALVQKPFRSKLLAHTALGLLYISLSWGLLINLYTSQVSFGIEFGLVIVSILIATVWINDGMAYIIGSFIGKTPLSSISPNKTWEGALGGALLAVVTVTLACYFILTEGVIIWSIGLFALIGTVTGTLGDLLESKLKRMANVKDSGQLLPGHGGFLDRFDSLLLATPFIWLYVAILQA